MFKAKLTARSVGDLSALPLMRIANDPQADNNARASFAAHALVAYARRVGDSGDLHMQISDLLCDLLHLADAVTVDFDACLERARIHYADELRGA